jgi:hypothetical protein
LGNIHILYRHIRQLIWAVLGQALGSVRDQAQELGMEDAVYIRDNLFQRNLFLSSLHLGSSRTRFESISQKQALGQVQSLCGSALLVESMQSLK